MKITPLFDPEGTVTPKSETPPPAPEKKGEGAGNENPEIASLRAELKRAKELEAYTKTLTSPDTTEEAKAAAFRKTLKMTQGWDDTQIEEYITSLNGDPAPEKKETPPETKREGVDEETRQHLLELRKKDLRRDLDSSIDTELKGNKNVSTFVKKIERLRGDDGAANAHDTLKRRINEETLRRLEIRKGQNRGRFDSSWVAQEVKAAAESVVAEHLSVIGDLDRIGRTPETGAGYQEFLSQKPVERPKYERGMTVGDAQNNIRSYNVDALTRLALETDAKEGSKI